MKTHAWIAIVLALPLFGFHTAPQNSSDGDSVSITVQNSSNSSLSIMTFDDSEVCAGKKVVSPVVLVGDDRTINVPYSREVTFGIRQIVSGDPVAGEYCQNIVTFEPVIGKRYAVDYAVDSKYCRINFVEIDRDDSDLGSAVAKPIVGREWKRPFFENGPSCKKRY